MPVIKRVLCLANSKKMTGRCVAGREVLPAGPGPWIRPVSNRASEEVSEYERQYADGTDPRVLDVIDIPLIEPRPHACQTENWLLEPDEYWERVARVGWTALQAFVEVPGALWINGHSTYHGENDEIPRAQADLLTRSLYLVRVNTIELRVFAPSAAFGNSKRRVLATFRHGDSDYALWVTDPLIEREYLARDNGEYQLGESCLCISLGEPFTKNGVDYRYKLVASIIQRSTVEP